MQQLKRAQSTPCACKALSPNHCSVERQGQNPVRYTQLLGLRTTPRTRMCAGTDIE